MKSARLQAVAALSLLLLSISAGATAGRRPAGAAGALVGRWFSAEDKNLSLTFRDNRSIQVSDRRADAWKEEEGRYDYEDGVLVIRDTDFWNGRYQAEVLNDTLRLFWEDGAEDRYVRNPLPASEDLNGLWEVTTLYDYDRELALDEEVAAFEFHPDGSLLFRLSDGAEIRATYSVSIDRLKISGSGRLKIDGDFTFSSASDNLVVEFSDDAVVIRLERP